MQRDINEVKSKLAELARQKDKRIVGEYPEDPTRWWPASVRNPRTGQPFTYVGAWDFIVEQLNKNETLIKQVFLKKPCGKLAYELRIKTECRIIYIKVRLGKDKIIGRSFHYSGEG